MSQISAACDVDKDILMTIYRDILAQFIEQNKKGKECILNFRMGFLHAYPNGDLQFETKT